MWWMGYANGSLRLAARLLSDPTKAVGLFEVPTRVAGELLRLAGPDTTWDLGSPLPMLSPHFPFGYAVEPDAM